MFDITDAYWYKQMSRSISYAVLGWSHRHAYPDASVYQDVLEPDEVAAILRAMDQAERNS